MSVVFEGVKEEMPEGALVLTLLLPIPCFLNLLRYCHFMIKVLDELVLQDHEHSDSDEKESRFQSHQLKLEVELTVLHLVKFDSERSQEHLARV